MAIDFYDNNAIIDINLIIIASFLALLSIILLRDVFNIFSHETNNITVKSIKIAVILYLIFTFIESTAYIIGNLSNYLFITTDINDHLFESISYFIGIEFLIAQAGQYITIAYFFKVKFEETYNHTFFKINKPFINILFIIFSACWICNNIIVMMYEILSYWYSNLYSNTMQNTRDIALYLVSSISVIYFVVILILFNIKLHKFIALTMSNNELLSIELNNILKHAITKQTNLISIMVISILIYAFLYFVRLSANNDWIITLIHQWIYFVFINTLCFGAYLSLNGNDKYYALYCKCCHGCCVCIGTKLPEYCNMVSHANKEPLLMINNQTLDDYNDIRSLYIFNECKDNACIYKNDKCEIMESMIHIMSSYDGHCFHKHLNSVEILNKFHHLLSYHDGDEQFDYIYFKLIEKNKCNHFMDCSIHLRYYWQRKRSKDYNGALEFDLVSNILDKIHSFYYHSYDTGLRRKIKQLDVQNISNKTVLNDINYNKFNSSFDMNDGDSFNDNIYSFGERFEYQQKNEWYVGAKYDTLKDELLNNKLCCISINIYNTEYNKSLKHIQIDRTKKMQNENINKTLSIHHILSLLIYCHCDEYQNKWSATFRRIPYDEDDESLKARHSYFYYSSKYIRDFVEYFGSKLMNDNNKNLTLYHGVSEILYFHRTITQFNGPLSTSKEINVAMNFSNNVGIILALKYSFSAYPLNAKYFDCSYFSDYVNEKECLLIGGIPMMIITNIINVANGENYGEYINALNVINSILNGTYKMDSNDYVCNVNVINLCCSLLFHQLTKTKRRQTQCGYPEYVINLLDKYCMNLTNITVFWHYMIKMKQLQELFCIVDTLSFFDLSVLLNLFPNIKQIEYFNQSFSNKKIKSKNQIKNIIKYIVKYPYNKLKYIIIHHNISRLTLNCGYFVDEHKCDWDLYHDKNKIILYKKSIDEIFDINSIHIHFNEITQGNITQHMLTGLV